MMIHNHASWNSMSWPDLYFAAECGREPFQNVKVVTLKSFIVDLAYEKAINDVGLDEEELNQYVRTLLDTDQVRGTQHVKVTEEGVITVVVDCEQIDDSTVWVALRMVGEALDQLNGNCGEVAFGSSISYKAAEIAWFTPH